MIEQLTTYVSGCFDLLGSTLTYITAPLLYCNEMTFITHSVLIGIFAMGALRLGRGGLTAFMAVCWVLGNLFVIKEATLFGLNVITSDTLAIGANLSITLLREYYGEKVAKNGILIGFFTDFFFVTMAMIHLAYVPSTHDITHPHFAALLGRMPRIMLSSLAVALVSVNLNLYLFSLLKKLLGSRFFGIDVFLALAISQAADTFLFALFALYGSVESIVPIIIFSTLVKIACAALSVPIVVYARRFFGRHESL